MIKSVLIIGFLFVCAVCENVYVCENECMCIYICVVCVHVSLCVLLVMLELGRAEQTKKQKGTERKMQEGGHSIWRPE